MNINTVGKIIIGRRKTTPVTVIEGKGDRNENRQRVLVAPKEDKKTVKKNCKDEIEVKWGRATKHIIRGDTPIIPEFARLWQSNITGEDQYYDLLFREFSYGYFPKDMYFDHHRRALIMSKFVNKEPGKKRKGVSDVTTEVIAGKTIFGNTFEITNTNVKTIDTSSENLPEEVKTTRYDEENLLEILRRGYSRGELLIRELLQSGITDEQFYVEVKFFLYKVASILSPTDSHRVREREGEFKKLMNDNRDYMLDHRSWSKITKAEKEALFIKYYLDLYRKTADDDKLNLTITQQTNAQLWFHCILSTFNIPVTFSKNKIENIPGFSVSPSGKIIFDLEIYGNKIIEISKIQSVSIGEFTGINFNRGRGTQ